MGQTTSDLSTEEVEDSTPSTLGIGESIRRRRARSNLSRASRHLSIEEVPQNSAPIRDNSDRPDGRSTGGGRYNLRIRSNTGETSTMSSNSGENDTHAAASTNDGNDVDAGGAVQRRRIGTGDVIQISGRRGGQASSILRLEGATLRSVLAVLTGRHDDNDDDSDDSDTPLAIRGRGSRRFEGMRMHNQDDTVDGSNSNSSNSSDEEEWVRRIAGVSRGASFRRRQRYSPKNSRKSRQKIEPDMIKMLQDSDFSVLTRQSLGMSPFNKSNCDTGVSSSLSTCKALNVEDKCTISVDNDGSVKVAAKIMGDIDMLEKEKNGEACSVPPSVKQCSSYGAISTKSYPSQNLSMLVQRNRIPPVSAWVSRRELGDFTRSSSCGSPFSHGRQCMLMSKFIPNKRRKIATFSQKLFCGTYSNCGNLFLSACQDQNIRIFDTTEGKFRHRRTIRARDVGWSVLDTSLSPDNRHLIYSSWCDYIYQVDLYGPDGQFIKHESKDQYGGESNALGDNHQALNLAARDGGDRFCIFSMRFSQDGDEILCGAKDGYIYVYDREANQRSLRVDAHEDDVNAVAFVDSATHILASGGDDGVCKIWDRRALRETDPVPVGVLAGHVDGITYIDPRGDGRHLITNSKDQSIKLWDLRCFSSKNAVDATKLAVKNQNWDYRWQGVPRKTMAEYRQGTKTIADDSSLMTYRGHTVLQTLIRCRFSPAHTTAQRYIYTGCASGSVFVYDVLTGEIVQELNGHKSCVRDVSWHPYRSEITSSSWDSSLSKWTYQEQIKDDTTLKKDKANKVTNGKSGKTTCRMKTGGRAPQSGDTLQAAENSDSAQVQIEVDSDSEDERTELRRSKRARNTRT